MLNKPLVSIIMPAYNAEKYIENAILSILAQTYSNWELLVVDDCSTDSTKKILKKFSKIDSRIKPIYREENSGKPSITKNSAIAYVQGFYVAFLDSDDLWIETKLEKQLALIIKDDFALCYTGGFLIDKDSHIMGNFIPKYKDGSIFNNMLLRYEINNQSVLIKREIFRKFNEDITIGEDYNLYMHIIYNNKVCSVKEKLIKYRVHSQSITKSKTKDLSEGTIFTLKELNNKYNIFFKYPFSFIVCWAKAIRFKILH